MPYRILTLINNSSKRNIQLQIFDGVLVVLGIQVMKGIKYYVQWAGHNCIKCTNIVCLATMREKNQYVVKPGNNIILFVLSMPQFCFQFTLAALELCSLLFKSFVSETKPNKREIILS